LATKGAAKAHRQSLKRRLHNRTIKSATKTAIKNATDAIAAGDPETAREAVRDAIKALDSAGSKGILHANNVARRKSRLVLKYNAAVASIQSSSSGDAKKSSAKSKKSK
jgi:small subunit ribosomal protein S20